jgi:hypothetical protein
MDVALQPCRKLRDALDEFGGDTMLWLFEQVSSPDLVHKTLLKDSDIHSTPMHPFF